MAGLPGAARELIDVKFPPMDDPPPGFTMRVAVERVGGVGPWT
jgi:hypothetical protein